MNKKTATPKTLMDEDGLCITRARITTPDGEYALDDVSGVGQRVSRPLWGPVLLALLGSINLAMAFQARSLPDIGISLLMLGAGLFWRFRGARHVLRLDLRTGTEVDAWFAKRGEPVDRAAAIVRKLVDKRRAREEGAQP